MSAQSELLAAPQVPLRYLVRFNPRPTAMNGDESCYLPMEAISEFGAVDSTRMRPTAELAQGYSFIADGDVAYAKVTPCFENGKGFRATGLPGGYAFATTEITVMRPSCELDSRYLAWVLQSEDFREPGEAHMSGAGGLKRVPESYAARYRVPHPRIDVQRAVADYLDRETAQIDAFIAKNEELITLLTERRATVIDLSVFGLRDAIERAERRIPDFVAEHAALRDFVARTPLEWSVARFKSVTRRRVGRNRDASATMRSLRTTGEVVRRTSHQNPDDSSIPRYILVEPDDLVINPMWLVGGAIGVSTRHGAVSPDYRVFRPRTALAPRYLHHLLRSRPYRAQYELLTRAETTFDRRVNQPDLDRLPIPIPPVDEQIRIAAVIDRELSKIDATIEVAKRSVALARERRSALISAAVTGKINVGVAA